MLLCSRSVPFHGLVSDTWKEQKCQLQFLLLELQSEIAHKFNLGSYSYDCEVDENPYETAPKCVCHFWKGCSVLGRSVALSP